MASKVTIDSSGSISSAFEQTLEERRARDWQPGEDRFCADGGVDVFPPDAELEIGWDAAPLPVPAAQK